MKSDRNRIYQIFQIEIRSDDPAMRDFFMLCLKTPPQEFNCRNQPGKIFDPENVLHAFVVKAPFKPSQRFTEHCLI